MAFCFIGVGLCFWSDLRNEKEQANNITANENPYPHALWGDLLCLGGSFLYAVQRDPGVHREGKMDRVEYLGMLGMFVIITFLQLCMFEFDELYKRNFFSSGYLIFGFVSCLFLMYITTSYFLTFADASLFNMSLLTADFYIAIFFICLFHGTVSIEYIAAFILFQLVCLCMVKNARRKTKSENPWRRRWSQSPDYQRRKY